MKFSTDPQTEQRLQNLESGAVGRVRPLQLQGRQRVANRTSWIQVLYLPPGTTVYYEGAAPITPPVVILRPGDAIVLEGSGEGVVVGWPE